MRENPNCYIRKNEILKFRYNFISAGRIHVEEIAKMLLLVCFFFVALVTAEARELNSTEMEAFEGIFFRSIVQHVAAEYNMLLPALGKHVASVAECEQKILETEMACKTCVLKECRAEFKDGSMFPVVDVPDKRGVFIEADSRAAAAAALAVGSKMKYLMKMKNMQKMLDFANIASGVLDMGQFIGDILGDMTCFIGNIGKGIGGVFGGIFGRRRRSMIIENPGGDMNLYKDVLPAKMRQCVLGCTDCVPFLEGRKSLTGRVCGNKFERAHLLVKQVFDKIRDLVYANGDPREGKPEILIKVEYDEKTCSCVTFLCDELYVTAMTPNGEERYKSAYKYNINVPELTAEELALELFQKWETIPKALFETPESATILPTDMTPLESTDEPNKYF